MLLDLLLNGPALKNEVTFGSNRFTWLEVADRALRLAGGLERIGIRAGDVVAIVLPNSLEFLVSLLAVTRVGAVAVPLNPACGHAELEFCARTAKATTFIVHDLAVAKSLAISARVAESPGGIRTIACSPDAGTPLALAALMGSPPGSNTVSRQPNEIALYLHSSGSTGRAKLIPRTFAQLIAEADSFGESASITPDDCIFCSVPMFHAYGLGDCLLAAFRTTCRFVGQSADRPIPVQATQLLDTLEHERVTVLPGVPFFFDVLLRSRRTRKLSSLRLCLCGTTPLAYETFVAFRDAYGVVLRQQYGCSEAGAVTVNFDDDIDPVWNSVGRPLRNVEIVIEEGDALGVGSVGIRSLALTRGYLETNSSGEGQSDNIQRFRDGTFHTDDLGRLDSDGRLYLTGRRRQLLEVAGNKVDPREVEAILLQHPAILEAVVLGVPAKRQGQRVMAVLVTAEPLDVSDVRTFCNERMAAFKVPEIIERRTELPKSPLGKVLRDSLF